MDTIGNFHILRELGRGSSAVVYLVEDTDGCQYALKLLHSQFATEKGVKLLQREVAINRRLFHPSIVRIIEYTKFPPDSHYLIMEYAEGQDLGQYLDKKGRLSIPDTLEIAWNICNALEFAHSWRVIHRDIKPQNIIFGKDKTIKITDFGLARAPEASISSLAIGTAIGTPNYISPEQAAGQKGDERSDLYSLGVIMYQMLTGKVPFDANDPSVLLDMHRRETPKSIRSLRPKVPLHLAELVNKAMAKSPSDRFQSAKAMSQAIKEVADQVGIVLEKRAISEPLWRRIQKMLLWPHTHWPDVVTELWANIIWKVLTSALVLTGGIIFTIYGWSGENLLTFLGTTSTMTPTNFPVTFTPTATSILTSTKIPFLPTFTQTPTNIPIPPATTDTPTNTSTPTDAPPTPTAIPIPPGATATPKPLVAPTATSTLFMPIGQFILIKPTFDDTITGPTEFEWQWTGQLQPDQGFEVRVWREGEPPAGVHNAVMDNQEGHIQKIGDSWYQLTVDISQAAGVRGRSGDYLWTVLLVQIAPKYAESGLQAEPARLHFVQPGNSGSDGSGRSGGGNGGGGEIK